MLSYSGKFVVRVSSELHKSLADEAKAAGKSLNSLCIEKLSQKTTSEKGKTVFDQIADALRPQLLKKFGNSFVGLLAFGSFVSGTSTEKSDIDLLVVLSPDVKIGRDLYNWWDDFIKVTAPLPVNPHFVNYLSNARDAGSLWFEISQNHKILFQQGTRIDNLISSLNKIIDSGIITRHWSNGHPYWIWRNNEEQNAC